MQTLQTSLFILQIIIAVSLTGIILLQKSGDDALSGIGGSGGNLSALSSKASANILTKTTMILAFIFMFNCLILGVLASRLNRGDSSVIDKYMKENNSKVETIAPTKENNSPIIPDVE